MWKFRWNGQILRNGQNLDEMDKFRWNGQINSLLKLYRKLKIWIVPYLLVKLSL